MTCILYNKVVKGASNRPKSGQNLFSTHILFTYQNIYRTLLSISLTVISRFNNLGAYSRYYVLKQTNKKNGIKIKLDLCECITVHRRYIKNEKH